MRTAIIGGGAAGFFAAIRLKELVPAMDVTIFERSQRVLAKVEVTGGFNFQAAWTTATVAAQSIAKAYAFDER